MAGRLRFGFDAGGRTPPGPRHRRHRRYRRLLVSVVTAAMVVALVPEASAVDPPRTTRVSRHSLGPEGNGFSAAPAISDDGRFVAFRSAASNLVSGDTNGEVDIFVHDRMTARTTRVSRHSLGNEANDSSQSAGISGDGRYVVFASDASNLVSGDNNGVMDIFVHDRLASTTGRTTRVSRDSLGNEANAINQGPSISNDGRFVAFNSDATNLVSGDTNARRDIFVHDRLASTTGRTTRVSRHSLGNQANGHSFEGFISGNGRYVVFDSDATNLVSGDTNSSRDIFIHDRLASTTGRTLLVSKHSLGNRADDSSHLPRVSDDGRIVTFLSDATNLVSGDTNAARDVFTHHRFTGRTLRVNRHSLGNEANAGASFSLAISGDGRFVGFSTFADNLVSGDTNAAGDVFVHDRSTARTLRVSRHSLGNEGNAFSGSPSVSGDGQFVAFNSSATNLVSGDTNGESDVFVRQRW